MMIFYCAPWFSLMPGPQTSKGISHYGTHGGTGSCGIGWAGGGWAGICRADYAWYDVSLEDLRG